MADEDTGCADDDLPGTAEDWRAAFAKPCDRQPCTYTPNMGRGCVDCGKWMWDAGD